MEQPDQLEYYAHEALDRTHLIREMVMEHLHDHPFMLEYPEINTKVEEAGKLLGQAYQMIGEIHL